MTRCEYLQRRALWHFNNDRDSRAADDIAEAVTALNTYRYQLDLLLKADNLTEGQRKGLEMARERAHIRDPDEEELETEIYY
jgi:hypothetical protein